MNSDSTLAIRDAHAARVAHELRTPLASIVALTQLLLESDNLTPGQRSKLESMELAGEHAMAVANDLIDLGLAAEGQLRLVPTECRVAELLNSVRDWLHPSAGTKRVSLVAEVHPELPQTFIGDAQRLRQVLLNLASNAIRHTSSGFVALRVRHAELPAADNGAPRPWRWRFEVEDTGEGIPAVDLKELFTPYTQRRNVPSRSVAGAGLGLLVTSELVRAMGGQLQVRSEPGVGSLFWFEMDGR